MNGWVGVTPGALTGGVVLLVEGMEEGETPAGNDGLLTAPPVATSEGVPIAFGGIKPFGMGDGAAGA